MTTMMRNYLILSSLLLLSSLSSCSLLSPVKSEAGSSYIINAVPEYVPTRSTHSVTLLVMQPETSEIYNTTQMAYSVRPYQIAYFSRNHWAETPSQMLQPLIVQTMQNTHYFHAVVTPPFIDGYDYSLSTQILELQQDYTHKPAILKLKLRAQLSRAAINRVIATTQYSVEVPIPSGTPYGGVFAANRATAQVLRQLAEFCVLHRQQYK
jgi:cholesterol transport system auxiliary component